MTTRSEWAVKAVRVQEDVAVSAFFKRYLEAILREREQEATQRAA